MLRQIVSASLIAAIALCTAISNASAQGYPYSTKKTYTDKKGSSQTVYLKKDGGVAGVSVKRSGGQPRFVPGKRSALPIVLARLVTDKTITDPAPKRPISSRAFDPCPGNNSCPEPIATGGTGTRAK